MRGFSSFLSFVSLCFFVVFAPAYSARAAIPNDPSYVITNSEAAIERSATACTAYAAVTANIWTNAPAEVLTTPIAWQIRYIEIANVTESLTPYATGYVAVRTGPSTNTPLLTLTTGARIFGGASRQIQIRRPATQSVAVIPIWVLPQSAVTLCVTYYW